MTHSFSYLTLLALTPFLISCKQSGDTAPTQPIATVNPFTLVPDSGVVGATVTIVGDKFHKDGNLVAFSGAYTFSFWSSPSNGSAVDVRVPFGAESGPVTILIDGVGTLETPRFTVLDNYDFERVTVAHWNLDPDDDCSHALQSGVYSLNGIWHDWERTLNGDTVTLALSVSPWIQNCSLNQVIRFQDNGPNVLPTFLSMVVLREVAGSTITDTLKRGVIKIRDWNAVGTVRGEVMTQVGDMEFKCGTFGAD